MLWRTRRKTEWPVQQQGAGSLRTRRGQPTTWASPWRSGLRKTSFAHSNRTCTASTNSFPTVEPKCARPGSVESASSCWTTIPSTTRQHSPFVVPHNGRLCDVWNATDAKRRVQQRPGSTQLWQLGDVRVPASPAAQSCTLASPPRVNVALAP